MKKKLRTLLETGASVRQLQLSEKARAEEVHLLCRAGGKSTVLKTDWPWTRDYSASLNVT